MTNTDQSVVSSGEPKRLDDLAVQGSWYDDTMTFVTANRVSVNASLRYNFRFGVFLGAEASLTRGFHHCARLGRHRADASLSIGYLF